LETFFYIQLILPAMSLAPFSAGTGNPQSHTTYGREPGIQQITMPE